MTSYFDVFDDTDRLGRYNPTVSEQRYAERLKTTIAELAHEIQAVTKERDAARQALRDLVDARIDHHVVGHCLVRQDAMDVAAKLIEEWFPGDEKQ